MGAWNYYFAAKLGLFFGGYIDLHRWENLVFAAVLLLPLPQRPLRIARLVLAVPIAIVLLYHESRLPPISRLLSQWSALSGFSTDYLLELAGRFVNLRLLGSLFALFLVVASLGMRFRLSSLVILGLAFGPEYEPEPGWFTAAFTPAAAPDCNPASGAPAVTGSDSAPETPPSDSELNATLQSFYAQQAPLHVAFPAPPSHAVPFDIVLVHVCSLAWDDMRYVRDNHPLMQRFDVLFDHFNSAATYSGPASLRVLRSTCGQSPESALYDPAPAPCYLFPRLTAAGYTANVLLNHDGNYEGFLKNLGRLGGLDTPALGDLGARVQMKAFYGSPIYEDYDILSRWLKQRTALPQGTPVALYYNTISLHDGNKVPGKDSLSSLDTYKLRLDKLFDDLGRFLDDLEAAARPVMVVFIPEHGAALRGEKTQIAGMRELPSPAITEVPVGIKFVGLPSGAAFKSRTVINKPVSYLALTSLMADLMTANPYASSSFEFAPHLDPLPETAFVAENEKTVMMRIGTSYYLRPPDLRWLKYDAAP